VNVSKKKGDGDILKDLMKTAGIAKVREALGEYLKALKTGKEGIPCEREGLFSSYPNYALHCGLDSQVRLLKRVFIL
jgi:hypothetical protein